MERRRFLARIITTIHAAIGGTVALIAGGAIVSPRLGARQQDWVPAASMSALPPNQPTPTMLRVLREDGYTQVVDRRMVFLLNTGESQVLAIDSTCTHLGCRVSWDPESETIRCPCHGGVFDRFGAVLAGPPPAPLARYATRIEDDTVLVQL